MFKRKLLQRYDEEIIKYEITPEYEARMLNGENLEATELLPDGRVVRLVINEPGATVELHLGKVKNMTLNTVNVNDVTISAVNVKYQNNTKFEYLTLLNGGSACASPSCLVEIGTLDDHGKISLAAELPGFSDASSVIGK